MTFLYWRPAAIILGVAALAYAAAIGALYARQDGFIFPQRVNTLSDQPEPAASNYAPLAFTVPDGTVLQGLITPAVPPPSPTLVVAFGGNAHDVGGMVLWLKRKVFPEQNVAVAGVVYRGYPSAAVLASGGKPSQAALLSDAAFTTRALQQLVGAEKTYLVGYSLGSSVAVHTAQQLPVQGMALLAPFASIGALAQHQYPWVPRVLIDGLLRHPFPTQQWLAANTTPLWVVGAGNDNLVPPAQVQAVAQAAGPQLQAFTLLTGASHGGLLDDPRIVPLLQQLLHTSD